MSSTKKIISEKPIPTIKNPKAYLLANILMGEPEKLEANLNELYKKEKFFDLLRGSATKKGSEAVVWPV